MTAIGSNAITYDALGNPLTYGSTTFAWQNGRQLASISMNYGAMVYSFEYNDSGIRTSKTVNGIEHVYTLNGSQIVTESWVQSGVEYVLVYLYDELGAPIGMQYRTSNYAWAEFDNFYFEKDLFGDIVAIYNEAGNKIGSYKYDAWGACAVSVESTASTLEKKVVRTLNPFRYRGYYFDTETGFYYLQSRYYNPQWGRFLNADGYVNANGDLIGYNMYAYCSNNPVMYVDPTGESATLVVLAILATSFLTGVISAVFNLGEESSSNPSMTQAEAIGALAEGFITGFSLGLAASILAATGATGGCVIGIYAIAGGVGSLMGSVTYSLIAEQDWKEAGVRAIKKSVQGAVEGAIAGAINGPEIGIKGLAKQYFTTVKKQQVRFFKRSMKQLPLLLPEETLSSFTSWLANTAGKHYFSEVIG